MPPALKFVARYQALSPVFAPQMFGGMFRAALGPALKGLDEAAYRNLFTPEPRPELSARYRDPPPPLVIEARDPPGGFIAAGDHFTIGLTLIGEAAVLSDKLVLALSIIGERGLGKSRAQAELKGTECIWRSDHWNGQPAPGAPPALPEIPPLPDAASIALISPLRRKVHGDYLTATTFTARAWIEAIRERIALLDVAFGDAPFMERGPSVPDAPITDVQLWDVAQELWSSKGRERRDMSGVMGNFLLPTRGIEEHWPHIWAGQWYQVGARPNIGLGAYRVIPE